MSDSGAALAEETPGEASAPAQAGRPTLARRVAGWRWYPLLAILAVQAVASGRLAWVNAAFGDEANYLAQGRGEWRAWLNGLPAPAFHDSGAPQIYPPLGAAMSALGGLPAARLLSLAFMLGATVLAYLAARRLFDPTVALCAAALGAFNEPVLRLDFATYDAMSILLLMTGFYLAVRSIDSGRAGELVAASGICMLLASLVAVSYVIYIPVVAAVMGCVWARKRGWANAIVPVIWQFILIGGLTVVAVASLHVWADFVGTTVARKTGLGAGVSSVLLAAWGSGAVVACVAAVGVVLAFASFGVREPRGWLVLVLALAVVVVPAYQAYIGTAYSMDKHMAPGAEMAGIAGGYALSRVLALGRPRHASQRRWAGRFQRAAAFTVSGAVLVFAFGYGARGADTQFGQWPDTRPLAATLRGVLTAARPLTSGTDGAVTAAGVRLPGPGSLLVATLGPANFNPATFRYYLPHTDVNTASATDPAIAADIKAGRYSAAVQDLNSASLRAALAHGGLTLAVRNAIAAFELKDRDKVAAELVASHRYVITNVLPYTTNTVGDPAGVFVIWSVIGPQR